MAELAAPEGKDSLAQRTEGGDSDRRRLPFWKLLVSLVFLALVSNSLYEYYNADLTIDAISVSAGLDRAGVSSALLTHELAEDLLALIGSTTGYQTSQHGVASSIRPSRINYSLGGETLDIEIPETKLSLKAITQFLEHFLPPRNIPALRGDAVLIDGKLALTLFVSTTGTPTKPNTWTESSELSSVATLINRGAMAMLEIVDPIAAAMHHYYYDVDAESGMTTALRILEGESHSASPSHARDALVVWGGICVDRHLFSDAYSKFEEAARIAGRDETILLAEAAAYRELGSDTRFLTSVQQALQVRTTPATLVTAGDSLAGLSDSRAIAYYRAALRKDPKYWPAYLGLSVAAQNEEDWPAAVSFAHFAIVNTASPEEQSAGLVQLGNIALQRGRLADAIRQYQNAAKLNGGSVDEYEGIARASYLLGDDRTAESSFRTAVGLTSHKPSVLKDWGDMLLIWKADSVAAERKFKEAIASDSGRNFAFAHGALGILYYEEGKEAEAEEQFEIAVSISFYPARLESDWGDILAGEGRFDAAEAHYDRATSLDPRLCDARLAKARLRLRRALDQHRPDDGDTLYLDAFRWCAYPGTVLTEWSNAINEAGYLPSQKALRANSEMLSWDPGSNMAIIRLALVRGNDREIAAGISKVPYPAGLLALWGQEAVWSGEGEEARKRLSASASLQSEDTRTKSLQMAIRVQRNEVSRDTLDSALSEILDGSAEASLGDALSRKKWDEEAEKVYRNCYRIVPGDAYTNLSLGIVLSNRGKFDLALRHLRSAAEAYLRSGTISNAAGETYGALLSDRFKGRLSPFQKRAYEAELARIRNWIPEPPPGSSGR